MRFTNHFLWRNLSTTISTSIVGLIQFFSFFILFTHLPAHFLNIFGGNMKMLGILEHQFFNLLHCLYITNTFIFTTIRPIFLLRVGSRIFSFNFQFYHISDSLKNKERLFYYYWNMDNIIHNLRFLLWILFR